MDFKHSIPTATQVFNEKSHNCCSKVGANESDVDDDNSEKDKLLAKNSLPDIYGLPSQNVEVFSLGQHSETRDIQNTGYVDKWFDAGHEFTIALEYKCGVSLKELHFNDDKVRISESIVSPKFVCKVLDQAIGNHVMYVRRQNKWTTLSSPTYFVCNILMKTLKWISPINYSSWSVNPGAEL
ncbi:hypothetical protein KY284_033088 [Solanum tuberosum]|nr:hypothetical protein KY284_033088 [Solanum tuberosum]